MITRTLRESKRCIRGHLGQELASSASQYHVEMGKLTTIDPKIENELLDLRRQVASLSEKLERL